MWWLLAVVAAWTTQDYEIFKVNDKVKEIGDFNFYQWLGVLKRASYDDISKAYRKLSRKIHPDKFRGLEKRVMEKQYQTLSVVGSILKDNQLRQRYDYFLDHGFPKWRDTGYFYLRYRPGLIGTIIGLFLLVALFHFIAIKVTRSQDQKRLATFKETIRKEANTGNGIPDGKDKHLQAPDGRKFVVQADGAILADTEEGLVEITDLDPVTFRDSLVYKLPMAVYRKIFPANESNNPAASKAKNGPGVQKKKPKGKKIKLANGKVAYAKN